MRGRASLFEQERGSVPHTKFFLMEDMEGPKPVTYIRGTTEESQCDYSVMLNVRLVMRSDGWWTEEQQSQKS